MILYFSPAVFKTGKEQSTEEEQEGVWRCRGIPAADGASSDLLNAFLKSVLGYIISTLTI